MLGASPRFSTGYYSLAATQCREPEPGQTLLRRDSVL